MYSKDHFVSDFREKESGELLNYYSNPALPEAANEAILIILRDRGVSEDVFWQTKNQCSTCGGELSKTEQLCPKCSTTSQNVAQDQPGWCPACLAEVTQEAPYCTHCGTNFGSGLGNHVLSSPPASKSNTAWIAKFIIGLASFAILYPGALMAYRYKHTTSGGVWLVACVIAVALVVFSGMKLRIRWMVVTLLMAFAVGFSSCTANFHWG